MGICCIISQQNIRNKNIDAVYDKTLIIFTEKWSIKLPYS